ncbi:MAG: TrbM/KikA/MpfK family conjugal transfer protein, partial [Nitrospira sp.]|nr:TrbM/KikA/MpfK family conjugal transfer protein [Nitrospira sp.]
MTRHSFIISTVALVLLGLGTLSAEAESPGGSPPVPALSSGAPSPSVTPLLPGTSPNSSAVSILTGTARDACEAMLCLSAIGSAPAECAASLAKYHAVQMF